MNLNVTPRTLRHNDVSVYFHQLWQVYTLEWGVDNRGGTPGAGGKESVENLGNSAQFAVNLRLLWKKKSLCKKRNKTCG